MTHNLPARDTDEKTTRRQSSGIGNVLLVLAAFVIGAAIALLMVMDAPARSSQPSDSAARTVPDAASPPSLGLSRN